MSAHAALFDAKAFLDKARRLYDGLVGALGEHDALAFSVGYIADELDAAAIDGLVGEAAGSPDSFRRFAKAVDAERGRRTLTIELDERLEQELERFARTITAARGDRASAYTAADVARMMIETHLAPQIAGSRAPLEE